MQRFYLGTHQPIWITHAGVPLFISHRRLAQRKTLPRAAADWALDSGATPSCCCSVNGPPPQPTTWRRCAATTTRGELNWAAPQDMTCEIEVLRRTGLGVRDHQRRTVENFVELQMLWGDPLSSPFMPVIQGMTVSDYRRCVDMYSAAGIDLAGFPLVGIGSVCRRQGTAEVDAIMSAMCGAIRACRCTCSEPRPQDWPATGIRSSVRTACVVIPGQTVTAGAWPPAPVLLELPGLCAAVAPAGAGRHPCLATARSGRGRVNRRARRTGR